MSDVAQIQPKCATCVCWQEVTPIGAVSIGGGKRGECHRNPPQIIATAQGIGAGFPQTAADAWCAEWHQRGAPPMNG